jgi:hypothetical protein
VNRVETSHQELIVVKTAFFTQAERQTRPYSETRISDFIECDYPALKAFPSFMYFNLSRRVHVP